jgi:hypothetical protein
MLKNFGFCHRVIGANLALEKSIIEFIPMVPTEIQKPSEYIPFYYPNVRVSILFLSLHREKVKKFSIAYEALPTDPPKEGEKPSFKAEIVVRAILFDEYPASIPDGNYKPLLVTLYFLLGSSFINQTVCSSSLFTSSSFSEIKHESEFENSFNSICKL